MDNCTLCISSGKCSTEGSGLNCNEFTARKEQSEGMTYTPGPLTIKGPSTGKLSHLDDGGDYAIVDVHGSIIGEAINKTGHFSCADAKANALLWSVGPELLRAAKALSKEAHADPVEPEFIIDPQTLAELDAAIAKAEGGADD